MESLKHNEPFIETTSRERPKVFRERLDVYASKNTPLSPKTLDNPIVGQSKDSLEIAGIHYVPADQEVQEKVLEHTLQRIELKVSSAG